ncbi:MAG: hypothetical protein ACR2PT_11350 [Endozoicomonas sp.]
MKFNAPILSTIYNVATHKTIRAKFFVCENLIYDLFSVEKNDRKLMREDSDNKTIAARIHDEISSLAQPGKVSMIIEEDVSPTLGLLYNLTYNDTIRSKFKENKKLNDANVSKDEYSYQDVAFHSFNVTEKWVQEDFIDLINGNNKRKAIESICDSIKAEFSN